MKRSLSVKIIMAGLSFFVFGSIDTCLAISIPELIEISNKSREQVKQYSAHLVYTQESQGSSSFSSKEMDFIKQKKVSALATRLASQDIKAHNELYANLKTGDIKVCVKDLRDIDSLLKKYNLPETKRNSVLQDKTSLINGCYELSLKSNNPNKITILSLKKTLISPGQSSPFPYEGILFSGILDERLAVAMKAPKISKEKMDGQEVLKIEEIKSDNGHEYKTTLVCLPSLGYRLKSFEIRFDGKLISEITADDFRMINGIPFPFHTAGKQYDIKNNKLISSCEYRFEKVEFVNKLDEKTFKIHVPKGTALINYVLGGRNARYSQDQEVSIKDLCKDIVP